MINTNFKMNKKELKKIDKLFNKFNQDKWMRYEDDIVRYYYPKIMEWLKKRPLKWSGTAFTSGLGRQIAFMIEEAIRLEKEENDK